MKPHPLHLALLAAVQLFSSHSLSANELSIPEYEANPGSILHVPVVIDTTDGLSSIEFQVNYDPSILIFQSTQSGSVGRLYEEVSTEVDDGSLYFSFASASSIGAFSGNLAIMTFRVRDGAEQQSFSEISIPSFQFGDSTGVVAMSQNGNSIKGKAIVSDAPNIDNFKNGLPDWWETTHNLDLFQHSSAFQDNDGDGLVNLLEYAFVGNPVFNDRATVSPIHTFVALSDTEQYNALRYKRRTGEGAPNYTLWESTNLLNWYQINSPVSEVIVSDQGDGTETVNVLGSINKADADAPAQAFLKVEVE